MIGGAWLTINRACNMKCQWCYAQNAEKSNMSINLVKNLLNLLDDINVHSVMLIGGEPTVSNDLFDIIRECKRHGLYTTLITNGLKLADLEYVGKLKDVGLDNVSLSQKSYDRDNYINVTGVDGYKKTLDAIRNLSILKLNFSVSHVLTRDSMKDVSRCLLDEKEAGTKNFVFSFCFDFDACQMSDIKPENPYALWKDFSDIYSDLDTITDGKLTLQMGLPLCVCDKETLDQMVSKKQIRTVCQLQRRDGILFDTQGNIIPCNAMYKYKLGKYGVEFSDGMSLESHLKSKEVDMFYKKLLSLPDKDCLGCNDMIHCGGGCIANWFNYSFSEFKELERSINQ